MKHTSVILLAILTLLGCHSKSKSNSPKLATPQGEDEGYSFGSLNDTTDCSILLEMLKKECVALNTRLSVHGLKQISILVPLNKYVLDCDQFKLGNIPVVVNHQDVTIDSLKKDKPLENEPIRKLLLIDYKRWSNYKSIELLYAPSGSIFKIVVKMDNDKAAIDDFFCAKF